MVTEIMRMIETLVAGVATGSYVYSSPGPNDSGVWSPPLKRATLSCEIKPYRKPFSGE